MEVGIGRNLFQLDYNKFEMLLSNSWIKSLWIFSSKYSITTVDRTTTYPNISRENDVFLMGQFQAQGYISKKLQILNRCRINSQVLTLADIMNGKGDDFTMTYNGQQDYQKVIYSNGPTNHNPPLPC